ncbi:MAG: alpha-L-rhamnosidase N-terminal domain-containing protein, partial [Lentisphaeria bacterium]
MNNAVWITAPQATESPGRVFSFRKSFVLKEHPVSAVWTLTARGIVHIRVNGHDCDEQLLLPGWTDYRFRIPLRKIDISAFLVIGENHLEVLLGCGWYCGRITVGGYPDRMQYESRIPSWLGMLTLSFANGRQQVITSSPVWLCQDNNPLLFSDFYD